MDDHDLAAALAGEAGRHLLQIRSLGGAEGDRQANDLLLARLAEVRPDDAVLSEEAADDRTRLTARRVWIIDPLDGTREYGEPPRDDWAVHVALSIDGEPSIGAVALPAIDTMFTTGAPPVVPPRQDGPLRLAASRTRASKLVRSLAHTFSADLVLMGSAGVKAMAVVRGEVDAYVHSGGQYEWDSCAPAAVAMAAGLHVSRLDGSPLRYNRPDPRLPDLVISRPEFAPDILRVISQQGLP